MPRPVKLQQAIKEYEAGKIDKAALERIQDEACKDTIERFEKTGSPVVSDGEQRVRFELSMVLAWVGYFMTNARGRLLVSLRTLWSTR